MKKTLMSAVMVCALGLVGCGDGEVVTPPPEKKYDTPAKLLAQLEGKTMVMTGANIPAFPNGFDEDVNYGSATQCYQSTTMKVAGGTFNVTTVPGTLRDAPNIGNKGTCDHNAAGATLQFSTTNVLIENVQGDGECFDVTFTYTGFAQEGRGKISADGKTLTLELFFKDKAVNHRCANGAVGAAGVKVNGADFTGDAKQVYIIQ